MLWVAIFRALVNENRHDGEPVIRLEQYLLREQKPCGAVDEAGRVVDGCTEITGDPGAVLNAKQVIAAVPLESLVPEPECVAVAGWNQGGSRCRAASAIGKIEPKGRSASRGFYIVEPQVNVALGVVAVLRRDVRPRTRQKPER